MPTSYTDQFFDMDPANPPSSGTLMTVQVHTYIDDNDNGFIEPGTDTVNGSAVTRVWVDDTITVTMGGSTVTITGTTFYTADGGRYFTPNDGTVLEDATFQSSTFVNTSTQMDVDDFGPPCFVAGTMILTDKGEVAVENLSVGDLVQTMDNGLQAIQWLGSKTVSAHKGFAPIRFAPGAIGNDRALLLSPQHRVMVHGWMAELYFGQSEILVAAKFLVNGDDVTVQAGARVTYHHLMFNTHEIIYSNGAPSESFHPGEQILAQDAGLRAELIMLFPELGELQTAAIWCTARRTINAREASVLLQAA